MLFSLTTELLMISVMFKSVFFTEKKLATHYALFAN